MMLTSCIVKYTNEKNDSVFWDEIGMIVSRLTWHPGPHIQYAIPHSSCLRPWVWSRWLASKVGSAEVDVSYLGHEWSLNGG